MDVKLPDGRVLKNVPEGTTKAQIAEKLGMAGDRSLLEKGVNLAAAYTRGRTFGFGPKIAAGVGTAIAKPVLEGVEVFTGKEAPSIGELYRSGYDMYSKPAEQAYEDNRILATGAEIAGGLKTGSQFGKTGTGETVRNWTVGTKPAADASRLAKTGYAFGKAGRDALVGEAAYRAYKVGTAEPGSEGKELISGLPVGGAVSGTLSLAGSGIRAGYNALKPSPEEKMVKETVKQFKSKAEKFFAEQLARRPDLKQALQKAQSIDDAARILGIDLTTAEKIAYNSTDPLLAQQGVISGNPVTGGRMSEFYANRSGQIEGAYEKIASSLDPSQSYDEVATKVIQLAEEAEKSATKSLTKEAGPLYNEAFKSNQKVKSELIDKILKSDAGQEALELAARNMSDDMLLMSKPDKEATQVARELGIIGKGEKIGDGFKLQTLDYVKRAFDMQYKTAERAGDYARMRQIEKLRGPFVNELKKLDLTKNIPAGRDAATGRFSPASVKDEGAYERALKVYSGQPEKLAMRKRIGGVADIDPYNTKSVAPALMQGTQKTAQLSAQALGEKGSPVAASAIIREALETNRGAPESLVRKVSPNERIAEQLSAYLPKSQANELTQLNEVSRRVLMGNRLVRAPSPTQERTAAEGLLKSAAAGKDALTGNKLGVVQKLASLLQKQGESPQFYEDMYRLMTTQDGMKLAQQIASLQGTQAPPPQVPAYLLNMGRYLQKNYKSPLPVATGQTAALAELLAQ